jgi:hypothetical protein
MSLAQLASTRGVAVMLPASLQRALDMLADIVTDKRPLRERCPVNDLMICTATSP